MAELVEGVLTAELVSFDRASSLEIWSAVSFDLPGSELLTRSLTFCVIFCASATAISMRLIG